MRIVVIGDGKIGRTIAGHAAREGHEVTVVDRNPKTIEQIVEQYDVIGVCGNGASYDIQKEAFVDKADLVVATTSSDEVNILSCIIAKKLGCESTIARVRNYEYNNQVDLMCKELGISMTVNPDLEAANEIVNIINFPEAIKVDTFGKGKVDLVELYIPKNSPLSGLSLSEIHNKYQVQLLICAVQRGEEVFIPSGNFVLNAEDKIHITAKRSSIKSLLNKLGLIENKIKDVMIIGGGRITVYLAERLLKNKYEVKIIEKNYERCLELSDLLPNASIIHGDGTDQDLLEDEGIKNIDAFISLTGIDEENIIISMYADKQKAHKIICKINKSSFASLLKTVGVASVISPKEIVTSKIISYVRAFDNARGNNVERLYKLIDNKVEALEFIAKDNKKLLNKTLSELKFKENILIASIIRNDEIITPSGQTTIQPNDSVIVISKDHILYELSDILE